MHCPPYPDQQFTSHSQWLQQTLLCQLWMEAGRLGSPQHMPESDIFTTSKNGKWPLFWSRGRSGSPFPGGHPTSILEEDSILCLSPKCPNSKGVEQDQAGQDESYPHNTLLAETSLVPFPATLCPTVDQDPDRFSSPVSGCELRASPQPGDSSPQGVIPGWFSGIDISCSMDLQQELSNSRKTSTCFPSLQKWKKFIHWCSHCYFWLELVPLFLILDYLLDLKTSRLSINSVKVHLAATSAFHPPIKRVSIFARLISSRIIKGLHNLFPHIRHPTLSWDLNLVLNHLIYTSILPNGDIIPTSFICEDGYLNSDHVSLKSLEDWSLNGRYPFIMFFNDNVSLLNILGSYKRLHQFSIFHYFFQNLTVPNRNPISIPWMLERPWPSTWIRLNSLGDCLHSSFPLQIDLRGLLSLPNNFQNGYRVLSLPVLSLQVLSPPTFNQVTGNIYWIFEECSSIWDM